MRIRTCLTACLLLAATLAFTSTARAAEDARRKDPLGMIAQLRAKQLAKQLTLTEEQHKKVLGLFDEEAKKLAVIQADTTSDINQKYDKQMVIKKETEEKLPALFTEEQKTKYAEMKAKTSKKKAPAKSSKE